MGGTFEELVSPAEAVSQLDSSRPTVETWNLHGHPTTPRSQSGTVDLWKDSKLYVTAWNTAFPPMYVDSLQRYKSRSYSS